jgi:hypothetical protein
MMIWKFTGIPKQGIGPYLTSISDYCDRKGLPRLFMLVVDEASGRPPAIRKWKKYYKGTDVDAEQARVFVFDWLKFKAPSPQDFK